MKAYNSRLIALLVTTCVTTTMWVLFVQFSGDVALWLALLNFTICAWQLASSPLSRHSGPVALTFWSFTLVWLGFAPIVQISTGVLPWLDVYQSRTFLISEALFTLSLVAFIAGSWLAGRRRDARPVEDLPALATDPRIEEAPPRVAPLLLLGFALLPVVLASTGGLAGRFTTRDDVAQAFAESGASDDTVTLFLLNRLPSAIALVGGYATAYMLRNYGRYLPKQQLFILPAFGAAMILVLMFANPFAISRYIALSTILGVALGFVDLRSTRVKSVFGWASAISVLTLYPLASWFKKDSVQQQADGLSVDVYQGVDFDGFQMIANTVEYVHSHGYAFGVHILAAIGYFVPRSIWEAKPTPASLDVAADRGYSFQNLSLPIWGEFYLDLSIVGMVAGMLLYGYVTRVLDHRYSSAPGSLAAHLAVVFAVAQFGLIRGPLGGSVVFFGTVLILALAVFLTPRKRPRSRRPLRTGTSSRILDPAPQLAVRT
ncbi:hypothetical protein [Homoserinibacter sp. GY 40078]|uniref:hypothetical protein n=1 Tax=Homoserinibacter sp. GY 40078 TaxID=2603275 RepID=UPI0011CC2EE9|nr:hypothetical protein [Homoserinibacter sp. GY 40078]TXK19500.1 hypothetical protein FVQ89_06325 [Homoserinibacter sp. GY 40078]